MYQSILVANESLVGLDRALAKAAVLEHYSGAKIALLEVIYDELEKESDEVLPRDEKKQLIDAYMAAERHALSTMAKTYATKIAQLDTQVAWSENREVAMCRYALQHQADLIIKPKIAGSSPFDALRHPIERRLIANAACPVLISKVPDWTNCGAVLACVDVADPKHHDLNDSIIANAKTMAELLGVPLHLLSVTHVSQLSLRRYSSSLEVLRMDERLFASREQELQRLQSLVEGPNCEVHINIRAGNLVDELKSLADSVSAEIVVMGTAGREGIKRMLIGNSAEAVLHHLDVDLMCVRENAVEPVNYGESIDHV